MEYIKLSQSWECDNCESSKTLYPAEIDEVTTNDSSKNKLMNSSSFKMVSAKKLLSAVEPSEEILNLLAKARDDLRKQEATKAGELMTKEKLVEANQSVFPENFLVVAEHKHQYDERDLRKRLSNKSVGSVVSNNLETLASKTQNFVGCHQQKPGESLGAPLQIEVVRVPFQAPKHYERKPFNPQWFEHDDRDREEVEEAPVKKFEGVNMKSIKKSEAVNRWDHDLYDASQESQDEFPGYSKQLYPRSISKHSTINRWGHELYGATQQTRKSDKDFSDFTYGYGRRQVGSHGQSKYRSSFQEGAKSVCSRPFRGRGDTARCSQPRSEDRMNTQKDEISAINRDMANFYL